MNEKAQVDWGDALTLDGKYGIFPNRPIPELNGQGGAAFSAALRADVTQDLFAIVCSREYLPRIEFVNAMRSVDSASCIRLRDGGVVHWPSQNASYYTLIYDKPLAERYWNSLDEQHPVMSEDSITQMFVRPILKTLLEFQRTGIVHGGIRPTNIFWRAGSASAPQIGEALSAPCGVGQHIIFETIERGMCKPIARGNGTHADDCYAFGMTLAMVIIGSNPFRGMDDETILKLKMEKGSFSAVIGPRRLSSSQIELLRGLLSDDMYQRWTAEDVEMWMAGRRQTSKSSDAGRKGSRHFDIGGKEYWQVKPLAKALSENVAEAVKVIENGSLEKWLTRSLGDDERAKDVAEAVDFLKDGGKTAHYQEQLVARACIALDPSAPIRYRGLSVMPGGISTVLAHSMGGGETLQIISEIILSQFVTLWVNMQRDAKTDLVPLAQQMERMRAILEKSSYGDGVERVVYELNSSIPCLSPMLKNQCVLSPRHLLAALERVASSGSRPSEPMDRHIAGFLIAREKRSESLFAAMSPTETSLRRGLALLSLFGEMQYRFGPDQLPHMAAWLMPLMETCVARYLSRPMQEKLRRQAQEAAQKGNLSQMLRRLDDPARVIGDEQDFLTARLMYLNVKREIAAIEEEIKDKGSVARDVGRSVAASVASLLAIILMGITLCRALLQALG